MYNLRRGRSVINFTEKSELLSSPLLVVVLPLEFACEVLRLPPGSVHPCLLVLLRTAHLPALPLHQEVLGSLLLRVGGAAGAGAGLELLPAGLD